MFKKSKLYSILAFKCPQCYKSDFLKNHVYHLKTIGEPKEHCDNCGQSFSPEPGFYYGAMYVSYGLGVALFVSIWVLFLIFTNQYDPLTLVLTITIAFVALLPVLYSLSKIIWANMFIHPKK